MVGTCTVDGACGDVTVGVVVVVDDEVDVVVADVAIVFDIAVVLVAVWPNGVR